MRTRFSLASALASLTLVILGTGCRPAIGASGYPAPPGAEEEEEAEAGSAITAPRADDALPLVQASTPPTTGRATPLLNVLTPGTRIPARVGVALPGGGGFSAPDMPAPTTVGVLDAGPLGHDPQVVVSDRFLIAFTAHRYQMFDKATGAPLPDVGEIPTNSDFNALFSPLWSHRDHTGAENPQNINRRLAFNNGDPLGCDPSQPTRSNACVQEFYDSRIMWDGLRRRFWVESAARNHLWFCKDGDACDGPKQSRTQARRYIAIAVSKTDDPRQGFHRYILVNQYTDWPKIAVNERYLILGHRSSPIIHVFDADKLAAGNPDHGPVKVARLDERSFKGMKVIAPVTHHGATSGLTYLLGSDGSDTVRVFALYNADPNRAVPPVVLTAPAVDIGEKLGSLEGNAVYRNGFLYWTRDQWVPGRGKDVRQVRVTRLPVRVGNGRGAPTLWAGADPRQGYLDAVIGEREPDDAPGDFMDYEKPALDVNVNDDVVVVYSRKSFRSRVEVAPEVRYSILYHGEQKARPGLLLRRGTTGAVPDINDNGKSGIDLAYAQVDPADDRTIWVTHAWADARAKWWRQVIAATRP
jgi:hypothetical protein